MYVASFWDWAKMLDKKRKIQYFIFLFYFFRLPSSQKSLIYV